MSHNNADIPFGKRLTVMVIEGKAKLYVNAGKRISTKEFEAAQKVVADNLSKAR